MLIEYSRVGWEDAPSTETPIDAANLNKMDNGILRLSQAHDAEIPALQAIASTVTTVLAMVDPPDDFSTEQSYAVGARCTYQGATYRCISPVTAGSAWDSTKWEVYTVDGEVAKVSAMQSNVTTMQNTITDILGDFCTVENGATASQPYEAGAHILWQNKYCVASTAIAQNAAFAIGTNLTQTTVGEEIETLNTNLTNYTTFPNNTTPVLCGTYNGSNLYRARYTQTATIAINTATLMTSSFPVAVGYIVDLSISVLSGSGIFYKGYAEAYVSGTSLYINQSVTNYSATYYIDYFYIDS